jgi:signal transduction histidine kinase
VTSQVTLLSAMSLVATTLLSMQYVFIAQPFRRTNTLAFVRAMLVAVAWLVIGAYFIVEISISASMMPRTTRGIQPGLFLSLLSTCLFILSVLPSRRRAAIATGVAMLGLIVAALLYNLLVVDAILSIAACALIAAQYRRVVPYRQPRRLYLAAKVSLLGYMLVSAVYALYSACYTQMVGSDARVAAVGFALSLCFKLVHAVTLMRLLLLWMQEVGAEIEAQVSLKWQKSFIAQVAHEIQTPIAELQLRLDLLRRQSVDADFAAEAKCVLDSAERIAAIVRGNWRYYLDRDLTPRSAAKIEDTVSVATLIEAALSALQATAAIGQGVELARHYQKGVYVRCDAHELTLVFLNVLRNAMEAVPNAGGRISITTRRARVRRRELAIVDLQDNGPGLDRKIAERAFADGFSTKKGQNRGHGLSVARMIAEAHGGTLVFLVHDEGPGGAHVQLCLPLAEEMGHAGSRGASR